MLHLIESYQDQSVVSIRGHNYPAECLLEDDDGNRLALVSSLTEIPVKLWVSIYSGGARYLVAPSGEQWAAVTMETYLQGQVEHRASMTYRYEGHWVDLDDFPSFYDIQGESGQQVAQDGFVHLHAHSEFSALDGLSNVKEMVEIAANLGQPAIAVTDHGVCAAHPHLQTEAKKIGIKPIFGIEANLVEDRFLRGEGKDARKVLYDYWHLVMWAMNDDGLRNLWAMNTEAHREGFYGRPRMDWDTLTRHAEGVMASTACLRGPLAWAIREGEDDIARAQLARLLDIFGDRLYIELHTTQAEEQAVVNRGLAGLADIYGIPMIAVVDSHYPLKEDMATHKAWIASQTNKDLKDEEDLFAGEESSYHLMSESEVRDALDYLPEAVVDEAIQQTVVVADRVDASLGGKATPPVFSKGKGAVGKDVDRLIDICLKNWWKVAGKPAGQAVYEARFEREMKLLIDRDYCGYFLMVSDYCRWARDRGILVGPGRGSGSGSLVAFLSGITGIDPVEADLMFERFLTEGRVALPDFDVDFPTSYRQELTDYIIEKYGVENVVRVGTHIRLKNKGVIRDLARSLKNTAPTDYRDVEAISKIIDTAEADKAGLGMSWEDLWDEAGEDLEPYRVKYPLLFKHAEKMVGRLKTYGKHAAGVVIAPEAHLTERLPMRLAGSDLVSEFDMEALESLGLVKFDLLTLRTLDTIQMTQDLVAEQLGETVDIAAWKEEYKDPTVWAEIADGHTLGIFQIETPGGTKDTKRLKPQSLDELSDLITLVRPGPKRSGLTETYMRRKFGEEAVSVLDPRLEPILAKTFGCMIYQEQVISTFMVLAGYNSTEADDIRKILGKKQVEKIDAAGVEFLKRAVEHGTDSGIADIIWNQIKEYARYGFNRSHAYAYAMLGFWTAWFKFHYPIQFLAACMSTVDAGRIPEFINETRRMGFKVLPPDINLSGRGFRALDREIRYGLDGVKGVGDAAVAAIEQGQPYVSFDDFMERRGKAANLGIVKTLAAVGAFDSLYPNRRELEASLEWQHDGSADRCQWKDETVIKIHGLPCHFDWDSEPVQIGSRGQPLKAKPPPKRCTKACRNFTPPVADFSGLKPYTQDDIMEKELELLGVHLSSTPFDKIDPALWQTELAPDIYLSRGTQVESGENNPYVVPALVSRVRPHTNKNGKAMGFIGLYAVDADLDVVVFQDAWVKYERDLRIGTLCFAHLKKNDRGLSLVSLSVV